jgi:riboflavin synthase
MFTGIVEEVGEVTAVFGATLRIRATQVLEGTKLGDSIAIDGVDLTVARIDGDELQFEVMPETFRQSTLGRAAPGIYVNIERSLRPQDRISGHIVRGVVEGTGVLAARADDGDAIILTFSSSSTLVDQMVARGPVCVDGVSLTVIQKTDDTFSVSVVGFTQENTTLLQRAVGDAVNIETDILMRYVVQAAAARLRGSDE